MQKFIVDSGKVLIDVCAWIILVAIILAAAISMFTDPFCGICIFFIGLVLFISMFYLLYLLIDIKENLDKIVEQNEKNNTNT